MFMSYTTAPLSASEKRWHHPDFSLEERKPKRELYAELVSTTWHPTTTTIPKPPDEEKGRKFRSTASTASLDFGQPELPSASAGKGKSVEREEEQVERGPGAGEEEDMMAMFPEEGQIIKTSASSGSLNGLVRKQVPCQTMWRDALENAISEANGEVDLGSRNLREIPDEIRELSHLVRLPPPLTASSSAASTSSHLLPTRRLFNATQSGPLPFATRLPLSPPSSPSPRQFVRSSSGTISSGPSSTSVDIRLYLAQNALRTETISPYLFSLQNLTILTLRNNNLDRLPEGIGRLKRLESLNIGSNLITYLPSEILDLPNLEVLFIHPNRFLPPPTTTTPIETTSDDSLPSPSPRRLLGPLKVHFALPSLTEICTRMLLAPVIAAPASPIPNRFSTSSFTTSSVSPELITTFPRSDTLPLLPPHLLHPFDVLLNPSGDTTRRLSSSTPGGSYPAHQSPKQRFDPLSNICYSPLHANEPEGGKRFYNHAVERFEWVLESEIKLKGRRMRREENTIKKKGKEEQRIPVRWRGCGIHCLDWLEEE